MTSLIVNFGSPLCVILLSMERVTWNQFIGYNGGILVSDSDKDGVRDLDKARATLSSNNPSLQISSDQLRQKLLDTMLELETMKNMKTELLKLLTIACKERDQAREQLQCLMKKLVPSTTSNVFLEHDNNNNNNLVMLQTKANSSITESNSPSHVSSPVDSLFETVSSPEFSNMNVNVGVSSPYPGLVSYENPNAKDNVVDAASALIDCLANGKVLPKKGKLLEAVMSAGPLLHPLMLAGSLPTWRNPPPLSSIKIPPLSLKGFDELNSFPSNTLNSFQKSAFPSSHTSQPVPNLNPAGVCNNNTWQFTSNSSLKKQKIQYF